MNSVPAAPIATGLRDRRSSRSTFLVFFFAVALVLGPAGFWPSYFGPVLRGAPLQPVVQTWVIPAHAAFFICWLLGALVQATLVWRGRVDLHRRVGVFLGIYGALGVIVGTTVTFAIALRRISLGGVPEEEASFLFIGLLDMAMFASFLGVGILLRAKPEMHRRLLVLATLTVMLVGYGRFVGFVTPDPWLDIRWLATILYGLPIWVVIAQDVMRYGRLHLVYAIGMVLFLIKVNQDLVMHSSPWQHIGLALLDPFRG